MQVEEDIGVSIGADLCSDINTWLRRVSIALSEDNCESRFVKQSMTGIGLRMSSLQFNKALHIPGQSFGGSGGNQQWS